MSTPQDPSAPSAPTAPTIQPGGGSPENDKPLPPSELTFVQQFFIWSMIIVVGILFGVGSSVPFLQGGAARDMGGGLSENEVLPRMDVARRLQAIIRDEPIDFRTERYEETWVGQLRQAQYAERLGLMPAGAALDQVVDEFLAKKSRTGRTYRELMIEKQGSKEEVKRRELELYLATRRAVEALHAHSVPVPAVPRAAAEDLLALWSSSLQADQVELTPTLPQIANDDPEIQLTYDGLKAERFRKPPALTVTLALPEPSSLVAGVNPSIVEIQARYEREKESRFRIPGAITQAYKELPEVISELTAELQKEGSEKAAEAKLTAFNTQVDELGLERSDSAAFARAAIAAGLITRSVVIPEAKDGTLDLAGLGSLKDPAGLFAKEPGFITSPLQASGTDKTWFMLRVEGKIPESVRTLDEVRAEVVAEVAGKRVWNTLVEQAQAIKNELGTSGKGGLAKWAASPAAAAWKAQLTTISVGPITALRVPGADRLAVGDSILAASLTLPSRPVALALIDGSHTGVPKVRLVQISTIDSRPTSAEMVTGMLSQYRQGLEKFRGNLFDTELRRELGR